MVHGRPIGTAKGPGDNTSEFTAIAPDPQQQAKFGEFVYFQDPGTAGERVIFGRIKDRQAVRLWPNEYMAQPEVDPGHIARLLGFRGLGTEGVQVQGTDLYQLSIQILGRFDPTLRDFINPRIAPSSGTPIYLATAEQLRAVLSRVDHADEGGAYVGDLISRERGAVPIALDVSQFTSTHLAIIASTGSGKSYLAGVLLEEMMMPKNRGSILVIDPHGEYDTLQDMMNLPDFLEGDYRPEVNIRRPEAVHVRIDSLSEGDLAYFLPSLSEKMRFVLNRAYRHVNQWARRENNGQYGLEDLVKALASSTGSADDEEEQSRDKSTINGLTWRLNSTLGNSQVFDDHRELRLAELFRPGRCTVLQLSDIDEREQQMIVATLLRRAYDARKATSKGMAQPGDPNHLGYPIFCLLEEAHNFSPANAVQPVVSATILKTILSEGRKFGVSIGMISQRPGRLDSDVLSQCMTQCTMRIINPVDQNKIAESVESMGRDLIGELPSLSKGQAILAGAGVNTPVLINVRTRRTRHGGQDLDAPAEWRQYFTGGQAERDRRDQEPVRENSTGPTRIDGMPML